jgi:preprotein translocase subunit SecB
MTDTPPSDAGAAGEGGGEARTPMIRVLAQYVKDLSFENPGLMAPPGAGAPEIELGIDVRVEPGQQEGLFGVDLRLSAKAKRPGQESVVFICELVYAGLFQLQDARPGDVEPLLLIECPRLLFPFARRIIAEVTRDGGHPPLMIDPIDFLGLYRQQRQSSAQG